VKNIQKVEHIFFILYGSVPVEIKAENALFLFNLNYLPSGQNRRKNSLQECTRFFFIRIHFIRWKWPKVILRFCMVKIYFV